MDLKITSASEELSIESSIKENKRATLTFDILKRNEFVIFEGLIKAKSDFANIDSNPLFDFRHRYENTGKIGIDNCIIEKRSKFPIRFILIWGIMMVFLLAYGVLVFNSDYGGPISYAKKDNSENVLYRALIKDNRIALVRENFWNDWNYHFAKTIEVTPEELETEYSVVIKPSNKYRKIELIAISAELIFFGLLWIPGFLRTRRMKKRLKMIGL